MKHLRNSTCALEQCMNPNNRPLTNRELCTGQRAWLPGEPSDTTGAGYQRRGRRVARRDNPNFVFESLRTPGAKR